MSSMPTTLDNGRYQLGQLVGRGGMAEVHIALDTRLGRTVAVKIMRADLAHDEIFLTRFRREAHSVAQMNNPNIVNIYDSGEEVVTLDNGQTEHLPYLIMEYVQGQTLRDIIKANGALSVSDTEHVMIGVLNALEYSHRMGIIHRDIKPGNIMISEQGIVKVMDFGIARALDDSATTMTKSQGVVGTAQYLSPEQARGENVDMRSDLYSAGCVLYEMLTGRKPFDTDNPVSIAVMHMQNVAVRPRDINPNIPSGLEEIIMHAMEKDASKRYQTAAEMIRDIEAFKSNNQIIFGYYNAPEPTQYFTPPETGNRRVPQRERVAYEQNGGGGDYYEDYPPENESEPEQSKSLVIPILTAVTIVVLVVAAIVIFLIVGQGTNGSNSSTDEVPKVIGMNYDDAVLNYPNIDFEVAEQDYTDKYEENIIYKQSIEAGQFVKKNKDGKIELAVAVSKGVQKVQIPDLTNYTAQEAEDALKALGLTAEQKKTQSTSEENIEADHVIRTDPAMNEEVAVGSNVVIYVSQGVAVDETDVPKFVGMTQEDAQKEADSRKLKLEITEVPSTEEKGIVTEQDPEPGKVVVSGSTIKLNVSNGEQPEGEVTYGLENLPISSMSGMYTLSFTTDEDGVIASRQFVAESLTNASVSVKVKGKGSKVVKVSITSAQSGKTEVLGTYTFDFANKKFTASSENIEGALSGVAVQTVPAVTAAPVETAAPDGAPSEGE